MTKIGTKPEFLRFDILKSPLISDENKKARDLAIFCGTFLVLSTHKPPEKCITSSDNHTSDLFIRITKCEQLGIKIKAAQAEDKASRPEKTRNQNKLTTSQERSGGELLGMCLEYLSYEIDDKPQRDIWSWDLKKMSTWWIDTPTRGTGCVWHEVWEKTDMCANWKYWSTVKTRIRIRISRPFVLQWEDNMAPAMGLSSLISIRFLSKVQSFASKCLLDFL